MPLRLVNRIISGPISGYTIGTESTTAMDACPYFSTATGEAFLIQDWVTTTVQDITDALSLSDSGIGVQNGEWVEESPGFFVDVPATYNSSFPDTGPSAADGIAATYNTSTTPESLTLSESNPTSQYSRAETSPTIADANPTTQYQRSETSPSIADSATTAQP